MVLDKIVIMLGDSQRDGPWLRGVLGGGQQGEWLEAVRKFWEWGRAGHQASLLRGVSEVAAVLTDPNESPPLKLKTTKFLLYIVLLDEPNILEVVGQEVYPCVRNTCLFNRTRPIDERGNDFFRNNHFMRIASTQERAQIRNVGVKYVRFCLEWVQWLAERYPLTPGLSTPSLFATNYQALVREGVSFPHPHELTFLAPQRVEHAENQVEQIKATSKYLSPPGSPVKKKQVQSPPAIQYLERKLAEREKEVEQQARKLEEQQKTISQLKQQQSMLDLQKQSVIEKMRQNSEQHHSKVQKYQATIRNLTQQVRDMKILISRQESQRRNTQIEGTQSQNLQAQLNHLQRQNQQLRYENTQLRQQMDKVPSLSVVPPSTPSPPTKHRPLQHQQLQKITNQHYESPLRSSKEHWGEWGDWTYSKRRQRELGEGLEWLGREQKVRLRKALLKGKEVLFKNGEVQVGSITSLAAPSVVDLTLTLTNLTSQPLALALRLQDSPAVRVESGRQGLERRLRAGEQVKVELRGEVNRIADGWAVGILSYRTQGIAQRKVALALPLSLFKLVKTLPFSAPSRNYTNQRERVLEMDRRVLSGLDKFHTHFPRSMSDPLPDSPRYNLKLQLLQSTFHLTLTQMDHDRLVIQLKFKEQSAPLADQLLIQLIFLLARQPH